MSMTPEDLLLDANDYSRTIVDSQSVKLKVGPHNSSRIFDLVINLAQAEGPWPREKSQIPCCRPSHTVSEHMAPRGARRPDSTAFDETLQDRERRTLVDQSQGRHAAGNCTLQVQWSDALLAPW